MSLEVTCLEDHVGSVVGDLGRRRGQMLGIDVRGDERVIRAELPLAEAFGYAGQLGATARDRLMERTQDRPLPAGRISLRDAILLGTVLGVTSVAALGWRFNVLAAALTLATMFAYVAVYTPLKRVSTLNTIIGALPGAAPPLLGYAALAGDVRGWAWALFAILLVWQFPHFMAIAWLYRHDYARAGLRMLPVEVGAAA